MVVSWSFPLFVSVAFAAPPVIIDEGTDCPSAGAVSEELERIVSAPPGTEVTDRALIAVEGAELRLVLTTREGGLLGDRRLPAEGSCDERALSAAVVLAAWITNVHPEYLSSLPDGGEPPALDIAPPAPPAPAPAPSASSAPPPPKPVPPHEPSSSSRPSSAPFRFVPALGLGGEASSSGIVPAAELSLRFAPDAAGFGASAFVLLAGVEERPLGNGSVLSYRWPLGAGGVARFGSDSLAVELEVGAMLGLLHVEGDGFVTKESATDVEGGAYFTARVGGGSGRLRPFVAAKLLGWLGTATAQASVPDAELDLPALEGVFLVGMGFLP